MLVRLAAVLYARTVANRDEEWRRPAAVVPSSATDRFLREQIYRNSYVWIQTERHVRRDIIFTATSLRWLHYHLTKPSDRFSQHKKEPLYTIPVRLVVKCEFRQVQGNRNEFQRFRMI